MEFLDVGYDSGEDRLLLWMPMIVKHVINDDSPLRHWRTPEGLEKDASSTIAVEVRGTLLFCFVFFTYFFSCSHPSGGFGVFFTVANNHTYYTYIVVCVKSRQSVMKIFA